ncbi:MAG: RDD family protein [Chitinophagaceae bacterium]
MENSEARLAQESLVQLVPASYGKRTVNYVVDFVLFGVAVSFLLIAIGPVYPLAAKIINKQPIGLGDQLVISFLYGLYMSVMEAALKGKTIGKFITGTRAVTTAGYPVSSQMAFMRGLIRMIPFPFEQVSALSFSIEPLALKPPAPWHDRWSKSMVIDELKSVLPKVE